MVSFVVSCKLYGMVSFVAGRLLHGYTPLVSYLVIICRASYRHDQPSISPSPPVSLLASKVIFFFLSVAHLARAA